jgi:hypothetical protein
MLTVTQGTLGTLGSVGLSSPMAGAFYAALLVS